MLLSGLVAELRAHAFSPLLLVRHTQTYGQLLGPGQEVSLEYKFFPDPRLDPRDFVVALSLVYASQKGDYHALTFFNETINIVELPKLIDWELISLFGFFAAGLAGLGERGGLHIAVCVCVLKYAAEAPPRPFICCVADGVWLKIGLMPPCDAPSTHAFHTFAGYLLYSYVVSQGWVRSGKQRARAKRAAAGNAGTVAMSAEDQQDWVKGTPYDSFVKRNAARAATASTRRAAAAK